jgi:hypothetical protein
LLDDLKTEGVDEFLSLKASDLKMPRFRVMQPTSLEVTQGKVKPGTFYNQVTGESVARLPAVLLAKNEQRVMWEKQFKRGDKPICRSVDGIRAAGDPRKECAKCPFGKWENIAEGSNKPQCNMAYGWLALSQLDTSRNMPFRLVIPGASVKYTKDFFTSIAPRQLAPFAYKIVLFTEFEQNDKGAFYVVKYDIVGNVAQDILNDLGYTAADLYTGEYQMVEGKRKPVLTEKGKIFEDKKAETWNHFQTTAKAYMAIFKEAVDMDLTDATEAIPVDGSEPTTMPEGAMF